MPAGGLYSTKEVEYYLGEYETFSISESTQDNQHDYGTYNVIYANSNHGYNVNPFALFKVMEKDVVFDFKKNIIYYKDII